MVWTLVVNFTVQSVRYLCDVQRVRRAVSRPARHRRPQPTRVCPSSTRVIVPSLHQPPPATWVQGRHRAPAVRTSGHWSGGLPVITATRRPSTPATVCPRTPPIRTVEVPAPVQVAVVWTRTSKCVRRRTQ